MENFQKKILAMLDAGLLDSSQMANLSVQHDDWCDRLNGVGPCNCDPEIQFYPAQDVDDFVTTWMALRNRYRGTAH